MSLQSMIDRIAAEMPEPTPAETTRFRINKELGRHRHLARHHAAKAERLEGIEVLPDGTAYLPAYLQGRNANGHGLDAGHLYHALRVTEVEEFGFLGETALCGASPGRHSGGWTERPQETVTCKRCLRRMSSVNQSS